MYLSFCPCSFRRTVNASVKACLRDRLWQCALRLSSTLARSLLVRGLYFKKSERGAGLILWAYTPHVDRELFKECRNCFAIQVTPTDYVFQEIVRPAAELAQAATKPAEPVKGCRPGMCSSTLLNQSVRMPSLVALIMVVAALISASSATPYSNHALQSVTWAHCRTAQKKLSMLVSSYRTLPLHKLARVCTIESSGHVAENHSRPLRGGLHLLCQPTDASSCCLSKDLSCLTSSLEGNTLQTSLSRQPHVCCW